jgi:CubicO group peptidase (beta-lactamase class C family)
MSRKRPPRGSHAPGTFFFYNNWDFNALGAIAERASGRSLFAEFREHVAAPLQMQDFSLANTEYRRDSRSRYAAYLFSMSARDRARFGLLYLRRGCWRERQVVPDAWVEASLAPQVVRNGNLDFGYLWWSQGPIASKGLKQRIQLARGAGGQIIAIISELDLVVVTTTETSLMWLRDSLGLLPPEDASVQILYAVLDARQH